MEEDQFGTAKTQFAKFADEEAVKAAYEKDLADKQAAKEKAEREENEEAAEKRDLDDEESMQIDIDEIHAELEAMQAKLHETMNQEFEDEEAAEPEPTKAKEKLDD